MSQLRDRGVGVDDIPLDARRAPPPHSDRDIRGTLGSIAAAFELRGAATLATRVYCEWLGASEGALRREAADRFAAAARDLAGVPAVDLSREGRLHWRRLDNASFLKIAAALAERAPQVLDALYLRRQDLLDCSLAPLAGLSSLVTLDLAWCDPGQEKRAKFPTAKAPISAVSHSFRLVFGRAIISRNGLEAWMLFPERARAEHSR